MSNPILLLMAAAYDVPQILNLAGIGNLTSDIPSPTTPRPIVGFRFKTDGTAQSDTGDTSAGLTYSDISDNWIKVPVKDASLFEMKVTVGSQTGSAGTFTAVGFTAGTWTALTTQQTITFDKDTNSIGSAVQNITTIEIREVLNTANIVTASSIVLTCTVSA